MEIQRAFTSFAAPKMVLHAIQAALFILIISYSSQTVLNNLFPRKVLTPLHGQVVELVDTLL